MSGQIRYSDEFKIDAAAQATERVYSVKDVAERLGIAPRSSARTEDKAPPKRPIGVRI